MSVRNPSGQFTSEGLLGNKRERGLLMRWIERLTKKGGSVRQYRELSGSWESCAVGEARQDFPLVVVGRPMPFSPDKQYSSPKDHVLRQLGQEFHEEIAQGHRNKAIKVYDKIQARVRQLLREAV